MPPRSAYAEKRDGVFSATGLLERNPYPTVYGVLDKKKVEKARESTQRNYLLPISFVEGLVQEFLDMKKGVDEFHNYLNMPCPVMAQYTPSPQRHTDLANFKVAISRQPDLFGVIYVHCLPCYKPHFGKYKANCPHINPSEISGLHKSLHTWQFPTAYLHQYLLDNKVKLEKHFGDRSICNKILGLLADMDKNPDLLRRQGTITLERPLAYPTMATPRPIIPKNPRIRASRAGPQSSPIRTAPRTVYERRVASSPPPVMPEIYWTYGEHLSNPSNTPRSSQQLGPSSSFSISSTPRPHSPLPPTQATRALSVTSATSRSTNLRDERDVDNMLVRPKVDFLFTINNPDDPELIEREDLVISHREQAIGGDRSSPSPIPGLRHATTAEEQGVDDDQVSTSSISDLRHQARPSQTSNAKADASKQKPLAEGRSRPRAGQQPVRQPRIAIHSRARRPPPPFGGYGFGGYGDIDEVVPDSEDELPDFMDYVQQARPSKRRAASPPPVAGPSRHTSGGGERVPHAVTKVLTQVGPIIELTDSSGDEYPPSPTRKSGGKGKRAARKGRGKVVNDSFVDHSIIDLTKSD